MSKENHSIKKGILLLRKDLRRILPAAVGVGIYFVVGTKFLYSICPCVMITGFPCPGCGMTRAVFSILEGRFIEAWHLQPFSYAFLIFMLIFAFRRYIQQKETKSLRKYLVFLIGAMIVFYVYRMVWYFPGDPPMNYYHGSVVYRIRSCLFHDFVI